MTKIKRLPDTELELMLCLWDANESVQRSYFNDYFSAKGWSDSTILTMLARLCNKGFITCTKKGNKNIYTPIISKSDYIKIENDSFLNKLYKGSVKHFVACLADGESLSDDDIDQLEDLLKELKDNK